MKAIAFYLPQYHPIPENDKWWGKGFTDWINVAKAKPRFREHYQPHIPADLGFYDLRCAETREAQAKLAAHYGIFGFCYYHYWFNGKTLLERPFNEVIKSGEPDFPFCLCWANESWTRRWDGYDKDILMGQDYDNYDPIKHIEWLELAFRDRRYIKINGKPLFLIYRATDIPDVNDKIATWQQVIRSMGYPGIYVCAVRSGFVHLTNSQLLELGFDAIVEFQASPSRLPGAFRKLLNKVKSNTPFFWRLNFEGGTSVVDYGEHVERMLAKPECKEKVFPCVFPSWDNSPRKQKGCVICQNDDANLYEKWLESARYRTRSYSPDEQFVFINAWNEWAEGAHLEPDLRNGTKFLSATKEVIDKFRP